MKGRKGSEMLASTFRWKSMHLSLSSELTRPPLAWKRVRHGPHPTKIPFMGHFPQCSLSLGMEAKPLKAGGNWD